MKFKKETKKSKCSEIDNRKTFEQLGFKNHNEKETKSIIVMEISKAIKKKKLTQTAAAKILGISQPKMLALPNGELDGFSVERLFKFLSLIQVLLLLSNSSPNDKKMNS